MFLRNTRRKVKRILIRSNDSTVLPSSGALATTFSEACEEYIENNKTYLEQTLDNTDTEFATNIYNEIVSISETSNNFFNRRVLLLPSLANKGLSPIPPICVPSYFPEYDPYREMLAAVMMTINRLITTFCSGDKEYFEYISSATVSTSVVDSLDNWSSDMIRTTSSSSSSSNDFDTSLIVSGVSSNPTADLTNPIFGTETQNEIIVAKYYTAGNDNFNSEYIVNAIRNGYSTFSLYASDNVYKNIMSAMDYISFDPNVNPTSCDGLAGDIPFRDLMRTQFIRNAFITELLFPIAPYRGTGFINSWIQNGWGSNCYPNNFPQLILEVPNDDGGDDGDDTPTFNIPSSFKFSIHALVGDVD